MAQPSAGGGIPAIKYSVALAGRVGWWRLWRAMRSRNSCKTCALGMGGQKGGMRNELGRFPEVCKKSLQAMAADMQGAVQDHFFSRYSLSQLATLSPRELESAGRLVKPLWAGPEDDRFRSLSWDEARRRIAAKLKGTSPDQSFFYFSGRSSNEAGFLLQLMARQYGTNNVNNCSYYCHQASGVGLAGAIGTGTATVSVDDIEKADLFFLIGGNPASNHPRLMTHLMHLRRRGGQVIVVNPVRETGLQRFRVPSDLRSLLFGTEIATDFVQLHIGTDIAFMIGVAKALLEQGFLEEEKIVSVARNWPQLKRLIRSTSWTEIGACGVTRSVIDRVAQAYGRSQRTIFAWTMGITHHRFGVENVQWIANLALMRGMVGRPGSGLLPIRGHSNVQGMGTIGVVPTLKAEVAAQYAKKEIPLPVANGLDTIGCMHRAASGRMQFGLALGGNLFGSNPDSTYARDALHRVGMMVYLNTTLNSGHIHGRGQETLILPVLARDEEPYFSTQESMFNFVRLSEGGPPRHAGPLSELQVIASLGQSLGLAGPFDWSKAADADYIRSWIAALIPSMQRLDNIGKTKEEFHIPGRIYHKPKFTTKDGKAVLNPHTIPEKISQGGDETSLRLMTVRSEGQFNTVVYEEEDLYRGQDRRDVILMNPEDMLRLGLKTDQSVSVASEVGSMSPVRVRPFDIRAGNSLMYFPEANQLVSRDIDPRSKTPSFKSTTVQITPLPLVISSGQEPPGRSERYSSLRFLMKSVAKRLWRRRRAKLNAC